MNKAVVGHIVGQSWDEIDQYLKPFPQITHAQADALATLAEDVKGDAKMEIKQTYTKDKGTHLYVRKSNGNEYHISRAGKVTWTNEPSPVPENVVKLVKKSA